ncbi:xylulose 5-phosphate 3-epimerase [Marinobacter koreensis]|uniref:Xylulose 5-phosphate 3-epimerase n=1 Tax=Marinobacter koreensis TaxID=335974 RepID=A0ABW0RNY5_9GAMM|nr:xylulose 5-phosphate 3-epimerase [Marinobacter koreensis]MCK7547647.1 xylulose 5-phosphate 3-epimerase [Marinobacter koreensis]MDX1816132.1 xylulose 5-phosphate 3-epimerase [Marinobacter sp.]
MPTPTQSSLTSTIGEQCPEYQVWRKGYGVIKHSEATCQAVVALADRLVEQGLQQDTRTVYRKLAALDRIASAGLWLVVHMSYTNRVNLSGAPLTPQDFKPTPRGHAGSALNMVPAYAGYLALNDLTGRTRSWVMGQGHCVAAIEAINVLTGNIFPEQRERYQSPEGLSRLAADFYSFRQRPDGSLAAPAGSHVSAQTAGAILEGGYPGLAELQCSHMPLPGESLVAFFSDGAIDGERGSDWIPRWWRASDCGLVLPLLILNDRCGEPVRDPETGEGLDGLESDLRYRGFAPFRFDGRDPAAYVCALLRMEYDLQALSDAASKGQVQYPIEMPFGLAQTVRGFGFYGAGTEIDHDLPLPGSPRTDSRARDLFNTHAAPLWVDPEELRESVQQLSGHAMQNRPLERDHPLAGRNPSDPALPRLSSCREAQASPMHAVDHFFTALAKNNPQLRVRIGDSGNLSEHRLPGVLDEFRKRVSQPRNPHEDVYGGIVSVRNDEAVASACLGNKAGLNLVVGDEAFCVKILGILRQELTFARQQKEAGRPPRWLGLPVVATAHTWENPNNAISQQDTTFCEALLGEMGDVSRVLFPADYNSTLATLPSVYTDRGRITGLVVPAQDRPRVFDASEAESLARNGALVVDEDTCAGEPLLLMASGAYQLSEAIRACERLRETGTPFRLVYLQEPGRFRQPRDAFEAPFCASELERERLFPHRLNCRVALTHMRPEVFRGHLHPLFPSMERSRVLGFINRGGTLNPAGMLFANQSSWGHVLAACAAIMEKPPGEWLSSAELAAVEGRGDPTVITRGLPTA